MISAEAVSAFARPDDGPRQRVASRLTTAGDYTIRESAELVAAFTDNLTGALQIADELLVPERRSPVTRSRGRLVRALIELARGRRQAASEEFALATEDSLLAMVYEAWYAAVPWMNASEGELRRLRDTLQRTLRTELRLAPGPSWLAMPADLDPHVRHYVLGLLHARLATTDSALHYAAVLESARPVADSAGLLPDLAIEIRALVLAQAGDTASALALLERMTFTVRSRYHVRASALHRRQFGRLLRADLLAASGREREALGWYDGLGEFGRPGFVLLAPAYLRQAQIHERLGDRDEAIEYYTRFITRWKDADADLQPAVDSARQRLAHLTGRPSRGETVGRR